MTYSEFNERKEKALCGDTNPGEEFPWDLVELCAEHQEFLPLIGIPEEKPSLGYEWIMVDATQFLAGHGGWLEVDLVNKKQGQYKLVFVS